MSHIYQSPYQANQPQQEPPKKSKKRNWIILGVVIAICCVVLGFSIYHVFGKSEHTDKAFSSGQHNVAVIPIQGEITESGTNYDQTWIEDQIAIAKNDQDNAAILLMVNSPGGAVYNSDETYLKLLEYKKETKRPVYAYFESLAASGGYYIAMAADEIYANRNTLTGSIGVVGGQFMDATALLNKLGVKISTIHSGKNKLMGHFSETPTEEQLAIMQSVSDEAYEQFVGIVAKGRHMDVEQVKTLADGRIYTAKQALNAKLIDKIATEDEMKDALRKKLKDEDILFDEKSYEASTSIPFLNMMSAFKALKTNELESTLNTLKAFNHAEPMYLYQGN